MAHPAVAPVPRDTRRATSILAGAALGIHGRRNREAAVSWALDAARALTGAEAAALWVLGPDGESEWTGPHRERFERLGDLRVQRLLRAAACGEQVVRLDEPLPLAAENASRNPHGTSSLLAVPVPHEDGTAHGLILLGDAAAGRFGDAEEEVAAIAAHLGIALDNKALLAALDEARTTQRSVVDQLQEAVRPPVPAVPETELGVHYKPADPGAPTGGDLYDWMPLPDGRLHLAVVDVIGKGVGATKDALAVTHALRLLVLDGCPLEHVVARADTIVTAQNPDVVATLVVARYDPESGELLLAGAGHPPALLVSADEIRELPSPGVPIGWPRAGSHRVTQARLQRWDTLLLYTDGLVEGGKNILAGMDALRRFAVETSMYPAAQQARVLVERALAGAERRDDSLALVLRRRTPPPPLAVVPLTPFEHRLAPTPATVPLARNLLREWLVRVPVEDRPVEDLLLIATELCANAVEHASWKRTGVVLRVRTEGADVVVEVEDDGAGPEHGWPELEEEPPDPEAEAGRGLWLSSVLSDGLELRREGDCTVARALKRDVVPPLR